MLHKLYEFLNIFSVTIWIVIIYLIKEKWTFNESVHHMIVALILIFLTIGIGALSLYLTKFFSEESLSKCIDVELADASSLPSYISYILVAFCVSGIYQLLVATIFISIFLYFVRWHYFNMTYLLFGYHYYHVMTDINTKVFIICKKEIRSPNNLEFKSLRRINNTTYIERE